jgi:hypothetical protein
LPALQAAGGTALYLTDAGRVVCTGLTDARMVVALDGKTPIIRAEMRARSLDTVLLGPEADRVLGISRNGYVPQTDAGRGRERLMAALGWPAETLTLEQLRARSEEPEPRLEPVPEEEPLEPVAEEAGE